MNRRDFIIKSTLATSTLLIDNIIPKPVHAKISKQEKIKKLEENVEYFRHLEPNTPSKNMILDHCKNSRYNFEDSFNVASYIFGVSLNKAIYPIIAIEQGKPYKEFSTGLRLKSPSGCRGLPQLSFAAYIDTAIWFNKISQSNRKDVKRLDLSPLKNMNPLIDIIRLELNKDNSRFYKKAKRKLKQGSEKQQIQNKAGQLKYEAFQNRLEFLLKKPFDNLFNASKDMTPHQISSRVNSQIHVMAAYLKVLEDKVPDNDFRINTYNNGLTTTAKVIDKANHVLLKRQANQIIRPDGSISTGILRQIIEKPEMNYDALYSSKQIKQYFEQITKQSTLLKYADRGYTIKTKIAQLEIELDKLKNKNQSIFCLM